MNVSALKQSQSSASVRRCENWVDSFDKYCHGKGSPGIFTRWAGIFTVAAALERKVWIRTNKGILYPNMYVFIVGPPGAGKTLALELSREFLASVEKFHLAPSSVTKASMVDALVAAERHIIRPKEDPSMINFNSLTISSNELGTFLTAYESDFMTVLTDLWDNKQYSETRRSSKLSIKIDNPQVSMIAATTPVWLTNFLPEGAWDMGFLSRVMLAFSGADEPGDLFSENTFDQALRKDLTHDISKIFELYGKMEFTPEAAKLITEWHKAKGPPIPDHPKLANYNTRRTAHLLKLCMVASAATGNDLLITEEHYIEALSWLIELEETIPDIFKSMKAQGDSKTIEEAYYYVYKSYVKDKKLVSESRLLSFLSERTPAYNVERIAALMVKGGLLIREFMTSGLYGYRPGAKD